MPTVSCMGDSITVGASSTSGLGYRDKLLSSQPDITYVGTLGSDPYKHDAVGGETIAQIWARIGNVIALQPDIVILIAGTNSITGVDEDVAVHQLKSLAGALAWNGARVIVGSTPPETASQADPVAAYNARIATEFDLMPNVHFVDICGTLVQTDDFVDALHPNEGGYVKMHAVLDAAWPPAGYTLGQGVGYTGAQRSGRGAWTL